MSTFTSPLIVTPLPSGIRWQLVKDFSYHIGSEDSGEIVYVPAGFVTDGASIPKFFWSIVGHPLGKYAQSAVLHDYLYVKGIYSRKKSDVIFLEAMKVQKVSYWKRKLMYRAVRWFAWRPWNRYRKKDKPT